MLWATQRTNYIKLIYTASLKTMAFACQLAGFGLMAKRDCCRCQQKVSFRLGNRALERRWCRRISCKSTSPSTLTTVYAISKSCKSYKSNASPRGIELAIYADITLKHWEVMWLIRLHLLYQNMLPTPSKIDFPICLWVQTLWTPTHMYLQCRIKNVTAGFIKCVLSEFDWVDAGLTIGLPTILDCSFFRVDASIERFTQFAVAISGSGWPLPYQWSLSTPQRWYQKTDQRDRAGCQTDAVYP